MVGFAGVIVEALLRRLVVVGRGDYVNSRCLLFQVLVLEMQGRGGLTVHVLKVGGDLVELTGGDGGAD